MVSVCVKCGISLETGSKWSIKRSCEACKTKALTGALGALIRGEIKTGLGIHSSLMRLPSAFEETNKLARREDPEYRRIHSANTARWQKENPEKFKVILTRSSRVTKWQKFVLVGPRMRGLDVSITPDELLEILEYQKQRCYWTGVPIVPSITKRNLFRPSPDRLMPGGPYSKTNVVVTSMAANLGRQDFSAKDTDEFFEAIRTGHASVVDPPKYWESRAVSRMRRGRTSRGRLKNRIVEYSTEDIKSLYEAQNGCCEYSGLPLGTGMFSPSVDRVDSSLGYLKDNTVICCRALNMAKSSVSLDHFKEWLQAVRESSPPNR